MEVAVLGLGEAGGRIASDLVAAGCAVRGFALEVAADVAGALGAGALYADLNTSAPELKRELSEAVPVQFVDVALVGVVPASGLATPALASGAGAERFAGLLRPLGMPVEVVGTRPGDAAALKLLRSVFMKGIAAAAIESLQAAEAAGVEQHVRSDIAAVLGEPLLDRLLVGSRAHAARRVDEMHAAAAYVEELGVEPRVSAAAAAWLEQLRDEPA
jgi:3-hydroxyisobutyrate dehydrogenase-like beta-hydroxyacid dehydrogenase